jgi:hypothetical protein
MALQKNHTVKGVNMTDAYHKVSYISGNKNGVHVDIQVCASSEDEAIDHFSFKLEGENMSHAGDSDDVNYTKQAYEHMKANVITDLSGVERDYTTAIDV